MPTLSCCAVPSQNIPTPVADVGRISGIPGHLVLAEETVEVRAERIPALSLLLMTWSRQYSAACEPLRCTVTVFFSFTCPVSVRGDDADH